MRVIATRRNMKAPRREADDLGVEMVSLDSIARRIGLRVLAPAAELRDLPYAG